MATSNMSTLPGKRSQPSQRRLQVLVAEDNQVNQLLATRIFEMLGHQATVVSNGREIFCRPMATHWNKCFWWMRAATRNCVIFQFVWRGEISTALSTLVHKRQVGHGATPRPKYCRIAQEPSLRNGATEGVKGQQDATSRGRDQQENSELI